jgi:hypothetical protein
MKQPSRSAIRFLRLAVIVGFLCAAAEAPAAELEKSFRGVVGVRGGEVGLDGTIEVKVRDLSGWLLEEIMQKRIPGGEHFKGNQFDLFFKLQQEAESKSGTGAAAKVTYGDLLVQTHDQLQSRFEKAAAQSKKAVTDKDRQELKKDMDQLNAEQEQWYSEVQAWQAWRALLREAQENLYLVLGPSQLTHVKAVNSFVHGQDDQDQITVQVFRFQLKKLEGDDQEWDKLYEGANQRVPVPLTLAFTLNGSSHMLASIVRPGPVSKTALPPSTTNGFSESFVFITFGNLSMVLGLGSVLAALSVFFILARAEDIVRDPDVLRPDGRNKFSLARCQTAFWFFLFTASYIFLWVIKRQTDSLTEQSLILLGISTGTTLGAAMIKVDAPIPKPASTDQRKRAPLEQFFVDLLSDASGEVVFHRFQTLVWTLVLGFVFIKSVGFSLKMPVFGANELTLMGISGATYVGFKFQTQSPASKEKPAPQDDSDQLKTPGNKTENG